MKGGAKEYWFVLTAESLSWFKDDEVGLKRLRSVFLYNVISVAQMCCVMKSDRRGQDLSVWIQYPRLSPYS